MSDKVAIVTGAGRGIGQAVAVALAEQGYCLALASRTEGELNATLKQCQELGAESIAAPTDVTVAAEVQALVDATMEAFGRVDLLANVAGVAIYKERIVEFTDEEFDATFAVNVRSVFLATRAVWPIMAQQVDGGAIVNVSSLASRDPFPGFAVYGASKAAVNLMTQSLARAGREHNIRLFALCPGAVETDMLRDGFPDFPRDKTLAPRQVADLVLWCAGDAARHCTGEAIAVSKQ
ncbi:MAG: 3-alpha-hydroxycholanate dehydrogenase (NADP(+)) [Phycisphaerae bacterium]|nr:3-alpha-hydroxycholanate dehydrogenase (NADP(+)) [Phycisphaerae bacterium]